MELDFPPTVKPFNAEQNTLKLSGTGEWWTKLSAPLAKTGPALRPRQRMSSRPRWRNWSLNRGLRVFMGFLLQV
jgi:hypothetical protein